MKGDGLAPILLSGIALLMGSLLAREERSIALVIGGRTAQLV